MSLRKRLSDIWNGNVYLPLLPTTDPNPYEDDEDNKFVKKTKPDHKKAMTVTSSLSFFGKLWESIKANCRAIQNRFSKDEFDLNRNITGARGRSAADFKSIEKDRSLPSGHPRNERIHKLAASFRRESEF